MTSRLGFKRSDDGWDGTLDGFPELIEMLLVRERLGHGTSCPYDDDNAVDVVRHDDKMVCCCMWKMNGDGLPNIMNNVSDWAQLDLALVNLAK